MKMFKGDAFLVWYFYITVEDYFKIYFQMT